LLTGKYNDGIPDDARLAQPGYEWLRKEVLGQGERIATVRRLQPVADELGVSLAQLAIAWCLLNPHVSTVMLGASRLEQLEHNLGAMGVVSRLDEGVRGRIEEALR
jgi:aryl-alcohol dehydrogenase-like predicted oxidoreductase